MRGLQAKAGQMVTFSCSHPRSFAGRPVIVTNQMQDSMGHVEQQLVGHRPPQARRHGGGPLHTDNHFAFEIVFSLFQQEAQNVRRIVVLQITPIQFVNRFIIDDRQAEDTRAYVFLRKNRPHGIFESFHLGGTNRLRIVDLISITMVRLSPLTIGVLDATVVHRGQRFDQTFLHRSQFLQGQTAFIKLPVQQSLQRQTVHEVFDA